ncbi:mucin-binding protein [Lactobacillus johnsonii]|uniref:Gram-positive signal peptide protein, YSIRK family n=3 Tax=Lactobacillus TaxID=1578 RepID=C2E4H4_LACJH|nr:GbpC/Spa domain-containing protein [Lactobacillus johnsonii]EEJ60199.1 Gram-positive signal peptide protein, YSIRK family [Lactobacillus johnsonii ATCC 33200]KRK54685.1 mucus binding protein precursor Mub [Lactobacillus johnsonii ATCC 33200]MCF0084891.1 YSIRK-type signal peptide-containing protein [Lactobacillus johnsonii]MCT3322726.1 YSIRK-type signal peptide-containing protein [Lactobacillus johnsonii]MCT3381646.1 YSIRK-type signal peptide-containing protein [Lactobacillus johnsonii]
MVSKNNYSEKMRKIRPQKQRFSIRKFTVGVASVLIGLTFMGINNQEVQADTTVAPEESVKVESSTASDITEKIESVVNTEEQSVSTTANQTEVMSTEENNEVENDGSASVETGNEEVKNNRSISGLETDNVEEQATNEVVTYNAETINGDTAVNNQNTNTTETNLVENTTPVEEAQAVEDVEKNAASVDVQPVESVESNTASVEETQPTENVETNTVQKKEVILSTPNYDTAKDQVNNYNQSVNDKLNGYENAPGLTIVEGDKVTINTNISGVNDSIAEAEKENNQQFANIDEILAQYKDAMDKYKYDLAKYEEARNAYIEHLKELGLWKEGDEDPLKLSQLLVLGNEENAVAKVEALKNGVTQGSGSLLDGKLNIFYKVSGNQTGDFLRVTYTNIQNSTYAGKTISKIVITYSDWTRKNLNDGRTSGIYFSKNPLDGFFYVGASGVTMDLKFYDADNNLITLAENTAYITVGSLNSTGNGTDYIEKAEIINTGGYRGSGVQLPESSVTVHKGQGEHGGDIVYSEKNNEIISKYNVKDKNTAIAIWGEAAVNKYTGWDEVDRKKEIFGSGLFKVNGIGVKIRFSNALGSAWSTFSTNIPKITFEAAVPEMPSYLIPWHKTEVNLNAQTSVHIHYVDVHEEAKKGTTDFKPEHGKELVDQKQSYHDLAINDQYSNTLWNWESANYILATDSVHPDAIQGTTTENEKHVYVYLKHNSVEDTRSKEVNQVIHYVYENGSQAAPDYKGVTLVFTQTGTKDTVTGEVVWDGEWTQSQRFESVESPVIKGYQTERPVVDAYDIVVDNSNFDQNLDKEDTVVYVANPTEEVSRDKVVNQVIHYVYENGSEAAPDHTSVALVFTQTGTRDTVTGEVVWDGEWTQSQRFESVASPTIKGYHTDRPVVDAYDIVVDNSNFDQNLDKEDTVVYVANLTEEVSRDKVVNQVIHYVYGNGSQAAPDYKGVTLVFTQTGTRDTVTGEVIWEGEWTQSQRFESVASPTIKGYHTDRPVVDAYDIVVDNSNFDQNLDKEDTVVYVADPVDPEEPKDPVDSEEPEDSKDPVQAETLTESTNDAPILPKQLSTDTPINKVETVENKESGKVEVATTEDVSLPQTGHKHSNAEIIGLGLATIASILGLAGTRKRKKD